MVNLVEFRHVVEILDDLASPSIVDRALAAGDLDRGMLTNGPGFLPYAKEAVVIEHVARAIGDKHLGARLGQTFDYLRYGAYARFVLSGPDLATALDRGRRALQLTHPGSMIVFRTTDKHVIIGRQSESLTTTGRRHLDEGTIPVIMQVVRHFMGHSWTPDWVELPDHPVPEVSQFEALVGAPVRTGFDMPGIPIRLTDLETLNPSPPLIDGVLSLQDLRLLMRVSPVQSMQDAVWQILRLLFSRQEISEKTVARFLAISPRALQRELKREGTTFRAMRLGFSEAKARELLSGTDTPIETIGSKLGYKEPKSFRRAFKNWTGQSPYAFRESDAHRSKLDGQWN